MKKRIIKIEIEPTKENLAKAYARISSEILSQAFAAQDVTYPMHIFSASFVAAYGCVQLLAKDNNAKKKIREITDTNLKEMMDDTDNDNNGELFKSIRELLEN